MQPITSKKRFSRSGRPSTHFLFKRDLADHLGPQSSYGMAMEDMFCMLTERRFARDFHCAGPGHGRPHWEI